MSIKHTNLAARVYAFVAFLARDGLAVMEQALADAQQRQAHSEQADLVRKRRHSAEGWDKNHTHTNTPSR